MADSAKPRSPHSPSFIPVVAPRPTRSTLPSSLSLPQLNLGPTPRRPSASSPSVAAIPVASSSNIPQTPGSAVSPFRSLRNLLPFGGGKQQASSIQPNGISNTPRTSFSNFGSVRRSMTGERKNSISTPRVEVSEPLPVISIGSSPQHTDTETDHDTLPYDSRSSSGDLQHSPSGQVRDIGQIEPSGSPGHPGDLSTIIEAETSGMSKHIPNLEDSQDIRLPGQSPSLSPQATSSGSVGKSGRSLLHTSPSYGELAGVEQPADSRETSALDWSTAELTAEVISAMKAKDVSDPKDWMMGVDGVVVDDAPAPVVPKLGLPQTPETERSFNFGALDPDLAALLSPNRVDVNDQTIFGLKPSLSWSPSKRSPPPSPGTYRRSPSRSHTRTPPSTNSPNSSASPRHGGFFPPAAIEGHSTPAKRRSAEVSKPATFQRPASLSGLPRLARSVTSTPFRQGKDSGSGSPSPQTSPELEEFNRRTLDYTRRRQPPSPLSASNEATRMSHSQRYESLGHSQRPSQSRLVTPARRTASYSTASARPALRHLATSGSDVWERDSVTPPERVPSSAGTASTSRKRLQYPRPSVDEVRFNGDIDRNFHQHRTRKRSTSLMQDIGGSPDSVSPYQTSAPPSRPSSAMSARRPAAEWLGPRTAKAFAAAGLLDHEKAARNGVPPARYAPSRGASEFDARTQYSAPSRMAFSEAGSAASWGRSRSASRTFTMSDAGGALAESPTLSTTPRTTFSGHSTAPTSISASSSMTQSTTQNTIQIMKEKHGQETEALLSALSDSQRTTKILREENTELRMRIDELETTVNQLKRRSASPQPPARPLSRIVYDRMGHPSLENNLHRRSFSNIQVSSSRFLHPNSDIPPAVTPPRDLSPNPFKERESISARRRLSTASSNFHLPPSNMSMLLHEGDMGADAGGFSSRSISPGPPSPTLVIPKRSSSLRHAHNHSKSMSSGGNISPTTVDFSITGSPGSLHLRPEHEMHLGDMASLDLALVGDDSDDDDGL